MSKRSNSECFDFESMNNVAISMRRGQEFTDKAEELSDFIANLNLPAELNSKLVGLMIEMVEVAEKLALVQGIGMSTAPEKYLDVITEVEPKS